jgi:hypothetical protein
MTTISGRDHVRAVLDTPVTPVPDASTGVAWLRSRVARFSSGEEHRRRRELAVAELARIEPAALGHRAAERGGHPVEVLADALGLRVRLADVVVVAASYQHAAAAPEADAAVARLVAACGGWDERSAARIGLLVQACDATATLVRTAQERGASVEEVLRDDPPVRLTRRGGALVDLASAGLPFGAGPHACPAREHAIALAAALVAGPFS